MNAFTDSDPLDYYTDYARDLEVAGFEAIKQMTLDHPPTEIEIAEKAARWYRALERAADSVDGIDWLPSDSWVYNVVGELEEQEGRDLDPDVTADFELVEQFFIDWFVA